jgi:hypothetical protein
LNVHAGVSVSNVLVASFTVTDPTGAPGSKWRALIEWGDGKSDALIVPVQVGNVFAFLGSHRYATSGSFTITVQISVPRSMKPDDNTVTTLAIVTNPPQGKGKAPADFDRDGRSDQGVFRPSTAQWIIPQTTAGLLTPIPTFGAPNLSDIPVVGDFDGVGHAEVGVFRPSTAQWFVLGTNGGHLIGTFGAPNLFDIPVPGDYDGVGHTELAVFRPSTAQWFVLGPHGGHLLGTFGAPNLFDIPVPGDYDGVGHTEMAVFRPSTAQWFVSGPSGGYLDAVFGAPNLFDIPIPGDYDHLGNTQPAVYRPSTSQWFALGPGGGHALTFSVFGLPNLFDIPVEAPFGSLVKLGLASRQNGQPLAVDAPRTGLAPASVLERFPVDCIG